MNVESNIDSGTINFGAGHILFVEGETDSIDVSVLKNILKINVMPLGPSVFVKSVAQAFYKTFPHYYFLIDRDHIADEDVEHYWEKFPNAETPNLLIWRKKEIENYFIQPEYLVQSDFLGKGKTVEDLQRRVLKFAQRCIYMAAANQVIVALREEFKKTWIDVFSNRDEFTNKEEALTKLLSVPSFGKFQTKANREMSLEKIKERFHEYLEILTGGKEKLEFGRGRWLDLLPGKEIMNDILGSSLFVVKDRTGKTLNGQEKKFEIIRNLLTPGKKLPADFVSLREIIKKRMADS